MPKSRLQMLLRGQNLLGYRHYGDDVVDRFVDKAAENGILVNPLQYDGYPSIGCWPCTRRVAPGEDARAGRWSGTNKTECGIHQ